MKLIDWQFIEPNTESNNTQYDMALIGNGDDERSIWISNYCNKNAKKIIKIYFNNNNFTFECNNISYNYLDFSSLFNNINSIIIDATTLEIPELTYSIFLSNNNNLILDIIYVEPNSYHKNNETGEYDLSQDGVGISLLPKFNFPTHNARILVALGFEGHRFGGLLQSEEYENAKFTGILGVPGFKVGMEKDCLIANSEQIKDSSAKFKIAGANDLLNNYKIIKTIYSASSMDKSSLICAPFGTKPVAIAMIWFAIKNKNVSIVYDFVKKNRRRTIGINKIHLWSFKC